MKKISSFVFILLLCLNVQAQIQRNFWGLELGRSTKDEVKNLLSSRKIPFEQNIGELDCIFAASDFGDNDLSLGGFTWGVVFSFYNNIMDEIQLTQINWGCSTSGETYNIDINYIYDKIKSLLDNKYRNLENPVNATNKNHLEGKYRQYYVRRDNQTVVQLVVDNKCVSLSYTDRKLARMSENDL